MITVIGYDGSQLSPYASDRLARASLVVGGARHLAALEIPDGARTVVMGPLDTALDAVDAHHGDVAVLASGDPGFFGIVGALHQRGHTLEVLPAVSSVALAFARVGLPWEDAAVVSTHGRDPCWAYNACRALPKVAVLTGPEAGPARLGAALEGWERAMVVAEQLGEKDERITPCTPGEAAGRTWAEPNVVIVLDERRRYRPGGAHDQVAAPPWGWALADDHYRHRDGMVTKWEIRALVLSRLRPTLGTLIWDVGAGSGSVAVECASLHAAVVAVEPDPRAYALVRENAERHRVDVRVVAGRAPQAYASLPDPDAVFIGGGGLPALEGALARGPKLVVATYAAVDRMSSARHLLRDAGYDVEGGQLATSRFADLPGGAFRLAAQNPVFLLAGELR